MGFTMCTSSGGRGHQGHVMVVGGMGLSPARGLPILGQLFQIEILQRPHHPSVEILGPVLRRRAPDPRKCTCRRLWVTFPLPRMKTPSSRRGASAFPRARCSERGTWVGRETWKAGISGFGKHFHQGYPGAVVQSPFGRGGGVPDPPSAKVPRFRSDGDFSGTGGSYFTR